MYYAMKGNKQLKITEPLVEEYKQLGYDIYQQIEGEQPVKVHNGAGKTVPYEQFEQLQQANGELAAKVQDLEKANKALEKAAKKAEPAKDEKAADTK